MSAVPPATAAAAPASAGGAARPATQALQASPASPRDPAKPLDVGDALQRLARSREQMRQVLMPATSDTPARTQSANSTHGVSAMAAQVTVKVKSLPGASAIMDAIRIWWRRHPLNMVGNVAVEATRRYAAPVAERNPVGLILGAVAAGAFLALLRPWRWLLRPALFAGLVPAIALRLVREVPAASWINVYSSTVGRARARTATTPLAPDRRPVSTAPASRSSAATAHAPVRQTATLP